VHDVARLNPLPEPARRLDQGVVAGRHQFLAQPAYVHIHGSFLDQRIVPFASNSETLVARGSRDRTSWT